MREIKFRAWDKVNKKMIKPIALQWTVGGRLSYIKKWETKNQRRVPIEQLILMQYTGLKDKNGKECYFGDLIKLWDERKRIFEVRWDTIMGRIFLHHLDKEGTSYYQYGSDIKDGKIIGNIYENPELLK